MHIPQLRFIAVVVILVVALSSCTSSPRPNPSPSSPPATIVQTGPFDLSEWKLTLPVSSDDPQQPQEIKWPALNTYSSEFYHLNAAGTGITFRAYVGGVTTIGSDFARSELREMTNGAVDQAKWSSRKGTHTMTIRESIDHLPTSHPSLVAGQVHGTENYVALIRLDGTVLSVKTYDETAQQPLDEHYQLGTIFTVKIEVVRRHIRVYYNDVLKVDYGKDCTTCYFKSGVYLQSNPDLGDDAMAYGEVTVYNLNITHQ